MAAWRWSKAGFIGSNGLFLQRKVEHERLYEAINAAIAARGCWVRRSPIE
ncbi:MAG TPA: hypothetical protein VIX20_15055 [Ktedonobacteraceae bacterium]